MEGDLWLVRLEPGTEAPDSSDSGSHAFAIPFSKTSLSVHRDAAIKPSRERTPSGPSRQGLQ
jgi:hypothetical protein